tara:strand:+ start:316 stop:2901 length:2586 start_codon:yes stop_codon:yes gene_type:complete
MSSNIGYLKSLVDGLSRKEKVDIAKAGHHELLPVYMVVDSLKKEQEMDEALKGIEAQNNMPTKEESTIREQLLAEIKGSNPDTRESIRELTSGIGSLADLDIGSSRDRTAVGGRRTLPGRGAGDAMPGGYSGPSWAGPMPGPSMTAARGGVVPGYANGGFYGQQEEEDFGFLNGSARPYFGEHDVIRRPDPLGGPGFLEDISPAGLLGFATTKADRVRRVVENLKNVDPKTLTLAERSSLADRKVLEEMLERQKILGPAWDATKGAFNRGVTGTRDLYGRGATGTRDAFSRGVTGTKDLYGRGVTTTKDWLSGAGSTIGGARDRFTGGIKSLVNRTTPKKTGSVKNPWNWSSGGNKWKSTKSGLKTAGKWSIPVGILGLGASALLNADPEEDMEYEAAVRERGDEGLGDRLTPQEADLILAQATDSTSGAGGPSRGRAAHFTPEQLAQIPSEGDINLDNLRVNQGPTRTMASTAGSEAALQAIDERMEKFRTDLGKLSPGQKMQEDLIKEQIERLEATRGVVIQRVLNRQGENVRTADADFASLEERYNTKVNAIDSLYEKRTGQLEGILQPRIDRGDEALASNAADYDANEKAAIWFAMSKAFGKRNTDPRNSGLDSIGTDLQDFRDTQADSASTMRGDLNDLEDLLQSGQISYEDAHLLATEQLGDQLFSGKRGIRDRRRTDVRTAEDSIFDTFTGAQTDMDALNASNIQMRRENEARMNALNPSIMDTLNERYAAELRSEALDQGRLDALYQSELEGLASNEIPRIESELDAQRVQEQIAALGDESAVHYDNTLGEEERIEMIIRMRAKLLDWHRRTSRLTDDEVKERSKGIELNAAGGVIPGYKHGGMPTLDLINRL